MGSGVGNAGMIWQAESDFYTRVAGGYFTEGVSHQTDLPLQVQQLANISPARVRQFERYIEDHQVGAILVDASHRPVWADTFRKLGPAGHLSGGVIVYPAATWRARPYLEGSLAAARFSKFRRFRYFTYSLLGS